MGRNREKSQQIPVKVAIDSTSANAFIQNSFKETPKPKAPSNFDYSALSSYLLNSQSPNLVSRNKLQPHLFWCKSTGHLRSFHFSNFIFNLQNIDSTFSTEQIWFDFFQPSRSEMDDIAKAFKLHPLTTEDILTPDTREKCEVFKDYYFVVIRTLDHDEMSSTYLSPITFYIVVFPQVVCSFHFLPIPHAENVLRRIDQLIAFNLSISSDWINYALIDDIVDSFIPIIKSVELQVDSIDELTLVIRQNHEQYDMLTRIGRARRQVNILLRNMATKGDVIKMVIHRSTAIGAPSSTASISATATASSSFAPLGNNSNFQIQQPSPFAVNGVESTRLYLEDIHDHVQTLNQNLIHYEKTLARSHSNYLAQISIELTQASNKTSHVVVQMTALASILVPLNIVTGLWGMNVKVPGQDEDGWFYVILLGMCAFSIFCYALLRRYIN